MTSQTQREILARTAPFLTTLSWLFEPFYSGLGHVLTFHRVVPETGERRIHNHQTLEITPEHLERTILFFIKKGYSFYSLDQLFDRLTLGGLNEKFVVFTFDDGYRDNLTVAYPILKKYGIPFTVYITTCFPDRTAILWWYILEDMLRAKNKVDFQWAGKRYSFSCRTQPEKEIAFDSIRRFFTQSFCLENHEEMYRAVFGDFQSGLRAPVLEYAMSWEEIRELGNDPLVTIGAHTVNHFPLKQLGNDALETEIFESKRIIETQTGLPVEHFAYPFGKAVEASFREFEAVKSLGFKTAVTTRIGSVFAEHKNSLECLPRISINQVTEAAVLELQTSGMLPFLINKGKRVMTH
ncbi:MAG: polysaccharide deacetylase family protein [Saprospiraceae bacterium]|nr:polysaccharide deacetylase family protein [Saprospiraceae bacterium]MCF8250826.1 polysaccharide deacetylase family protein [Saprospiraceae bacterium]MCF8281441.1 polysaccharide deacetylase family protein [Bacteroidales bacterium]MCF8312627.1 polysaccharide deacetylase family protein [Saprospiraceae bacterium]MCF8441017.1 polysaccharide deacetylase family protein [Saprospiraceae bacterium]